MNQEQASLRAFKKPARMLSECLECCYYLIKRCKTKWNNEGGSVIYHVQQTVKGDMPLCVGGGGAGQSLCGGFEASH